MLLWSFWNTRAKSVIKVFLYNCLPGLLHDCVPKQQASTSKSNDQIYCGPYRDTGYSPYYVKCFECLEKRYINVKNHYYYCVYLVASPVSVYQEVTVLLSLTHQMEMCFMRHSNFCTQVKFTTLDENLGTDMNGNNLWFLSTISDSLLLALAAHWHIAWTCFDNSKSWVVVLSDPLDYWGTKSFFWSNTWRGCRICWIHKCE